MTPNNSLHIILALITIDYLYNQMLDWLNYKNRKTEIPLEVADLYSEEKYMKSQEYQKVKTRFSFISSAISFIVSFTIIYSGGFGLLDQWLRPSFENSIMLSLVYFGVLFIASDLLSLPFAVYNTFIIEERFGFNKTTAKTFILDKIKGYLLAIIIGGVLLALLLFLIHNIGESFWIYFWIVVAVFMVFMNMFYTSLLLPLFNKLTPLDDGELKTSIQDYANSVDFPLDNIYVIDGSKRSAKANAFFSGIGAKKKIVLYDTLIENHSNEELVAILAHEVGHFKKKHIIGGLIFSVVQIGLMLFIMSQMIYSEATSIALGGSQMAIHLNLLAFGILYSPISTALGIISNIISRKNEYEADAFAKNTYNAGALIEALKKLSVDNLSNLYPHKSYVFVHYSHPPLLKRLSALGD